MTRLVMMATLFDIILHEQEHRSAI